MISKNELVNKYVLYIDRDGKRRIEKVVKVKGFYVTVVNAVKTRHRVHKDKILGRQFRKRGLEPINWDRVRKK